MANASDKYQDFIVSLLFADGFIAGREMTAAVVEYFAITDQNARKILQRAVDSGAIKSSKPLTFGKGQFIYMLPLHDLDLEAVKKICKKYRPPIYRMIDALEENAGIISYYEALKLSAAPEEKTSTKATTVKELIYLLVSLDLVTIEIDTNAVKYIVDKNNDEPEKAMRHHYQKMVLDSMFIPDILRWLKKVNLIDNLKTVYRSKQNPSKGALQNNLVWDAFAYTKTTGINPLPGKRASTVEKQTLVVLDVVISRPYSQADLDGFLARVQVNLNSVKEGIRKAMPVIIYKEISDKILNTVASLGFLSFSIGSVFGSRIHEIITKLHAIQDSNGILEGTDSGTEASKILKILSDAGQQENLSNLKGILFEYLLYPVLRHIYSDAAMSHGKTLSEVKGGVKEGYEYDFIILSEHPKELVVVEAKGYTSESRFAIGNTSTKNTLSWFFGKTVPFLKKKYANEISQGYRLKACFITSAGFFDNGKQYMSAMKSLKSKKLDIYYDGKALITMLQENDFIHIRKTIERFYIEKYD